MPGPRAKSSRSIFNLTATLLARNTTAAEDRPREKPGEDSSADGEAPSMPITPRRDIGRRKLRGAAHLRHHQMTIEACETSSAMRRAMPERLIVTIHANLIGGLDGLAAVHTKFDKPADTDPASGDGVIAAGAVASLASAPLKIVARFDLEQPAHFGFGEFAGEIEMAGITVHAADVFWLREVADVVVEVSSVRKYSRCE